MTNNPPSSRIQPGEYGFPLKLKPRYDNFIGGDWVAPVDGEYYSNLTPVTGQPLCEIASSGKRDIDLALDAAHKAKDKWGQTSVQDRAAILFKIADRMEQNLELLATAETWDNGKPIRETMAADVPLAIDHFRYFASCIRAQEGGISEVDSDTVAYHFHEPLGVVGQIIPWNFPLLMASWKMAPALAAGNCIVLKPARLTPLSVLLLMDIIGDLLPPGVINVVNGAGGEIAQRLITHPACAKVSFTGSVATGEKVQQSASASGKRVTLELGGKNAALFLDDLTPEAMVNGIIEAGYLNQGQICAAAERFYLPQGKLDAVLALLKDKLSAFAPGSPLDERTLMGPLANRQQYDKVLRLIQTARDEGDTIVCGGEALPGEGYFLQPTAVKVRSEESTLMREETFGPVCSFIGYRSEEEALARINASPYGLAASVWSDNIRQALRYSEAIEAGIVWVNMHTFLDPAVPFGGMKGSGIGREFGSAFIDDYTELKSVMVRY